MVKANGGVSFTRVGGSLTESVTLDPGTYTVTSLRLADPGTSATERISFTPWVPVSGPGDRP